MSVRRTWDKTLYESKARERLEGVVEDEEVESIGAKKRKSNKEEFQPANQEAAGPMGSERAFLKARRERVDVDSKVGKIEVINPTDVERGPGYWCEVCACLLKDSASYLDHINGKKHQRALGFSMRVERADVTSVRSKLSQLKDTINNEKSKVKLSSIDSYNARIAAQLAEEEQKKREKKWKAKKVEEVQEAEREKDAEDVDSDMAEMMGFGGFGTSKKR